MADKAAARLFDQNMSESYDKRRHRMAPIVDNLHFLIDIILTPLPEDAHILCVGVGTGAEIMTLAEAHPRWRFTGIDPSADMLAVCREQVNKSGLSSRVELFTGYLSEFPGTATFDGVLCLLVTQFVKDSDERQALFDAMGTRLKAGGYLINAELSDDLSSPPFLDLLEKWKLLQLRAGSTQAQVDSILSGWKAHVSILPAASIERFLLQSGFSLPVQFFQSFLIRAWYSQKN